MQRLVATNVHDAGAKPETPPRILTGKDACYGLKAKFQPSAKRRTNQFGPRLPVMARGLWQLDVAADPTAQ